MDEVNESSSLDQCVLRNTLEARMATQIEHRLVNQRQRQKSTENKACHNVIEYENPLEIPTTL